MKSLVSNIVLAGTSLLILASWASAQAPERNGNRERMERDTIVVTGTADSKAKPDVAYVTVGVVTQANRAQEASQANAAAAQKVVNSLRQQGIAERDIQTSGYNVQPLYESGPNRSPTITGYQVSNQVQATVRKLDTVGAIIDAALEAGANNVQGVSFGLEKRSEFETDALGRAVQAARRKADALARAAGVRVNGVVQIQEGVVSRPVPLYAGRMSMAAEAATPIEPGELTVTANVTVVYSITGGAASLDGARDRQNAGLGSLRRAGSERHPKEIAAARTLRAAEIPSAGSKHQ